MDARVDRELRHLEQADRVAHRVGAVVGRVHDALVERGIGLGRRHGDRRGAGAAEHVGGEPLGRADLLAAEVVDLADRHLRDEGLLAAGGAADNLDLPVRVPVEQFLQDLAPAAVIAELDHLPRRVVAGDQVAEQREGLVAAGEIDGRRQVGLQDALGDGVDRLVVRHDRADRRQFGAHLAAGHRRQHRQPALDRLVVEVAGLGRRLDLPALRLGLGAMRRDQDTGAEDGGGE